jgi:hypothetical protein
MFVRTYRLALASFALVGALAFATPAAAQPATTTPAAPPAGSPGQWTVTPFVGVGFSGDLDGATGAVGVAGGYIWSDRIQLEAEWNWLPSSENSGLVEVDSNVWQLTGNLLYRFNGRNNWSPYAAAGLGFGHAGVDLDINEDGIDDPTLDNFDASSTEFVFNFGGGVERRVSDRVAFRGDLRYFFGADLVPDFWRLSAGLSFGFGAR